jgi:6-phosphogluconolactonase
VAQDRWSNRARAFIDGSAPARQFGRRRFGAGTLAAVGTLGLAPLPRALGTPPRRAAAQAQVPALAPQYVFVGTYTTNNRADGLYVHRMDTNGVLTPLHTVTGDGTENPSFLALDRQGRTLYAVNEVGNFEGISGSVSAFAVDERTGGLTFLNRVNSQGQIPAHLVVDPANRHLLVANYNGSTIATFPIGDGGRLGDAADIALQAGIGPSQTRQERAHPHSIDVDPSGAYALSCDLGQDRIFVYRYDSATGRLRENWMPYAQVSSGAGPRHLAFHPNGRLVYVINELDSTIGVFAWDARRGTLLSVQTVPTLPSDFTATSTTAEIAVHPTGRFVYGSNRGHDSIAAFAAHPQTGKLTLVGHTPTQGTVPRNFAIDPSGTFLFAANQTGNTIVTFRIDQQSGALAPTGSVSETKTPVCLVFKPV